MTKSRRKTENGEGTMETPICPEHFRHARVWLEHQIGLLSKRLSDLESRVDHLEVNVAEERVQPDEDTECRKLQSHDDEQNIPLDISSVCQMLARSLLAAKHGQGFLPAIESSIGLYKMAREELNLLADFPESSGAAVEHCRTAILRLLTEQAICLEQIGVTIEEVDEGVDLIKGRHHVVR
ncbi:hypothetical protein, partial [Stieleria mannarensis]|uniref:hypothetical protein n=1 Tax=Stieleria mannarensis TaxID=2755585 RepID=UPI00160457FB